jgi:guanylate kinase
MKHIQNTLAIMKNYQKPLIIFGASGSGKTTLIKSTIKNYNQKFELMISETTRKKREGENQISYNFITNQEFEEKIKNEEFIEYVNFNNNYYGSSYNELIRIFISGKIPILDIDYRGVKSFIEKFGSDNFLKIFIEVQNEQILKERLKKRNTDTDSDILGRLEISKKDNENILREKIFDFKILNEDLTLAENKLFKIIDNFYF